MNRKSARHAVLRCPVSGDQPPNNGINISGGSGINIGGGSAFGYKTKVVNRKLDQRFESALKDLTQQARTTGGEAASILEWITSHAASSLEPPKAEKKLSKLKDVGEWAWDRLKVIVDSAGTAAGPWLLDVMHRLAS